MHKTIRIFVPVATYLFLKDDDLVRIIYDILCFLKIVAVYQEESNYFKIEDLYEHSIQKFF